MIKAMMKECVWNYGIFGETCNERDDNSPNMAL
jgi:hypothetical protein